MKNEIAQTWIKIGILFNRQLTREVVEMMVACVDDLPPASVMQALNEWPRKHGRFPLPADIREVVAPNASDKDEGLVIANKIWACVVKHGNPWSGRAKAQLGERAWAIVEMLGGWSSLCQTLSEETRGTFIAQTRDLVAADARVNKTERTQETPQQLEGQRFAIAAPTLKELN